MNKTREITHTAMVGALPELRIVFPFVGEEDSGESLASAI